MRHDELADGHVESKAIDSAADSKHEYGRCTIHAVARCNKCASRLQSVAEVGNRCARGQAAMDAENGANL